MAYFWLPVFTWASLYGQSTPNTAWRTSGHEQPYLRDVVDATLPGLPASTEVLRFTARRILTLQVMPILVKNHPSPTFFYIVWLTVDKVALLEITNAELTASSWTWQRMKVESEKPQTRHEPRLRAASRKTTCGPGSTRALLFHKQ